MKRYRFTITKIEPFEALVGAGSPDVYLKFFFSINGTDNGSFFTVLQEQATDDAIKTIFRNRVDMDMEFIRADIKQQRKLKKLQKEQARKSKLNKKNWLNKTITRKL